MDSDDPRLTGEHVRRCTGEDGDVVLVGVVHDHPASKYRARSVIEAERPDVLALELPPLALPLFEVYAEDERTPPAFGGEMSAAVQAATDAEVVAVDGPTPGFVRRLCRNLYRDRASLAAVRRVLRSLSSVARHAVVCRLAATLARRLDVRVEVDAPVDHEVEWTDDVREQADDERQQIRQVRSIMSTFEPSASAQYRSETREEHMAERLADVRADGDVVAVVGIDHLAPLCERLGGADVE